jgi:hypothetical protein
MNLKALFSPFALAACLWAGASQTHAAVYYLSLDQPATDTWNTTPYSYWKSNADGTGSSPTSINSGDDFYVNGHTLRPGDGTFAGNLYSGGTLLLKDSTGGTSSVGNLTLSGGSINNGQSYVDDFNITNLVNSSGSTSINAGSASGRGVLLIVGTLSGAGDFAITGNNSAQSQWNVTDATAYTGTITLNAARLNFQADFYAPAASLVVNAGKFTLDQAITVSSLTINSNVLAAGTHSYASLNLLYGTIFDAGTAGGSITVVPELSTGHLLGLGLGLATLRIRRVK